MDNPRKNKMKRTFLKYIACRNEKNMPSLDKINSSQNTWLGCEDSKFKLNPILNWAGH